MHISLYLTLQAALLATAALGRPSDISRRMNHGLMKRHFWCNGVDSETICPEGQTMVPIDDFACNAIAGAGRLNQISPPVNGESSTTCPQQQQQQPQQQPQPQPQKQQQQQQSQPQPQPQPQPQQQPPTPPPPQQQQQSQPQPPPPPTQPSTSPIQQQPPPSTPPTPPPNQGNPNLESTAFNKDGNPSPVKPANQGTQNNPSILKSENVAGDNSNALTNLNGTMSLSCTEVNGTSGGGGSFLLNCTMAG